MARTKNHFSKVTSCWARCLIAAPLALTVASNPAFAEPLRELCPDRPGKNAPPCIVDKGHLMLEFGPVRHIDERGSSQYEFGETLVRYGLTDMIEFQASYTPYIVIRLKEPTSGQRRTLRGTGDLTGAVKANLLNPDGNSTSVAIQAFATVPIGKNGVGAGAWEGGVIVPISFELSDQLGLTLDPEIDYKVEEGRGHHVALAGVASLSRDLGGGFEGSAEVWSMVHREPGNHRTEASFDLALAWTPKNRSNIQFDAEIDFGLTHDTPRSEMIAGVAIRF